ncbi:MAG: hypothetical protein WBS22_19405 [Methylocystis sp.]
MTQSSSSSPVGYLVTPDGRYFVVRGRLWRRSNPCLSAATRERLVKELMQARSDVRRAKGSVEALSEARGRVDAAKIALGERGPPWWDDGAPDYNRRMVKNTPYAAGWNASAAVHAEG